MKTLEWQNFFADQRTQHGKVVFSVAELANAAQTSLHAVNTELGRLVGRGIIHRYAHGRYGPTQGVEPEDILSAVDPPARLKQKLVKMELRPEMVAQRLKDLQENREHHATAIQKVIDQQMDPTVAQQMNSGGGGRAVLDSALNLILKVCPP